MSMLEPEDIYEYQLKRGKTMSCFYCEFYCGLEKQCLKAKYIVTGSESIDCKHYRYNGEVKDERK